MSIFPIDKLKPIFGKIEGAAHDASITIDLHPFNLQIYDGEKPVKIITSLRLDSINLPTLDGTILQYQSYEFPINPNNIIPNIAYTYSIIIRYNIGIIDMLPHILEVEALP